MDVREKLVELLDIIIQPGQKTIGDIADYLIASGVTVQEWIPANEPPKKITNKVIVLCKNGYMGFGHYEDYKGQTNVVQPRKRKTFYRLGFGRLRELRSHSLDAAPETAGGGLTMREILFRGKRIDTTIRSFWRRINYVHLLQ